jgi:hypothetical protein
MTKHRRKKKLGTRKVAVAEQDLTITRWDQFIAIIGLALGIYGISYFINTQDDLRFWLNRRAYDRTEFTVNEVKRVTGSGDDVEIILVGLVARTNQEVYFRDWLIYDPRVDPQPDDYAWSDMDDKAKIGVRFPIWFANDKLRIYYVSEFAEKPTDRRALQCFLLNLTYFGLSFYCLHRVFRKAMRLHASDSQTSAITEG